MDDDPMARHLASTSAQIRRTTQSNGNAQMARKSPNRGHADSPQRTGKMVRRPPLGRRPIQLHTRKVGEMTFQDLARIMFYGLTMSAGLVIMGLIGWLEAPGF
jgi:hypothetical protein